MRFRNGLIACLAIHSTLIFAQASFPPKDAAAAFLASRSLTSMGTSASGCTLQGTVTIASPGLTMPVVIKNNGTSKMRVELSTPKGKNILLVNGGTGVILQASGRILHLNSNNTVFRRVPYIPAFSILAEHQGNTTKLDHLPATDTAGEGVALSLWSDSPDGARMAKMTRTEFTLDAISGYVTKLKYTSYAENDSNATTKTEVDYSDYRSSDGLQVPFKQLTYNGGALYSTLTLESADCHTALSDSEFDLPKESNEVSK